MSSTNTFNFGIGSGEGVVDKISSCDVNFIAHDFIVPHYIEERKIDTKPSLYS